MKISLWRSTALTWYNDFHTLSSSFLSLSGLMGYKVIRNLELRCKEEGGMKTYTTKYLYSCASGLLLANFWCTLRRTHWDNNTPGSSFQYNRNSLPWACWHWGKDKSLDCKKLTNVHSGVMVNLLTIVKYLKVSAVFSSKRHTISISQSGGSFPEQPP